jgi:hypothetical protein
VDTGSGELIWLSNNEQGNHEVHMLNNSFQLKSITSPELNKYLNLVSVNDGSYAFMLNIGGHRFYVLTLTFRYPDWTSGGTNVDATSSTWVYDLETEMWSNWNSANASNTFTANGLQYTAIGKWRISGSCINSSNVQYVQDLDDGSLRFLDDSIYSDKGTIFPVEIQISKLDFGSFDRKFINRITVYTDSGNYYTTKLGFWQEGANGSGNLRTVSTTGYAPYETSSWMWGSLKRGTFYFSNTDDSALRISNINIDYDVGDARAVT